MGRGKRSRVLVSLGVALAVSGAITGVAAAQPVCVGQSIFEGRPVLNPNAVKHVYWGSVWQTDPALVQLRSTMDAKWKAILGTFLDDGPFYDPANQYGVLGGYFVGSVVVPNPTEIDVNPTPQSAPGILIQNGTVILDELEAEYDSNTADFPIDPGATPVFVVFFPPNLLTNEFLGCKDKSIGACTAQCPSCKWNGVGGFHGGYPTPNAAPYAHRFAFAVIPNSFYSEFTQPTADTPDAFTYDQAESHELLEAATNPPDTLGASSGQGAYLCPKANGQITELCDACEPWTYPWTLPSGQQMALSQIWMEQDGAWGCGPCGGQPNERQPCCQLGTIDGCNPGLVCGTDNFCDPPPTVSASAFTFGPNPLGPQPTCDSPGGLPSWWAEITVSGVGGRYGGIAIAPPPKGQSQYWDVLHAPPLGTVLPVQILVEPIWPGAATGAPYEFKATVTVDEANTEIPLEVPIAIPKTPPQGPPESSLQILTSEILAEDVIISECNQTVEFPEDPGWFDPFWLGDPPYDPNASLAINVGEEVSTSVQVVGAQFELAGTSSITTDDLVRTRTAEATTLLDSEGLFIRPHQAFELVVEANISPRGYESFTHTFSVPLSIDMVGETVPTPPARYPLVILEPLQRVVQAVSVPIPSSLLVRNGTGVTNPAAPVREAATQSPATLDFTLRIPEDRVERGMLLYGFLPPENCNPDTNLGGCPPSRVGANGL